MAPLQTSLQIEEITDRSIEEIPKKKKKNKEDKTYNEINGWRI